MTHLAKQKLTFSAAAIGLLSAMAVGMAQFRDADFTGPMRAFDAGVARAEYSRFTGDTFWSSLLSVIFPREASAVTQKTGDSVPVLLYHGIVANPDRFNISPSAFKEQMYALKRAGYQTVSLADFLAFQRGEKKLPERSFLLTFDDGRRDSYEGADPVLEALGFTAVMFTTASETVDDPKWLSSYYLSLNDTKKMIKSGRWEIGSHAVQKNGGFVPVSDTEQGNFLSSKRWIAEEQRHESDDEYLARVTHEVVDAKKGLEREFRVKVDTFAYPFGDYGQQTKNHPDAPSVLSGLIGQTYRAAFRQVWQHDGQFTWNHAGDDRLRLKRIETPTHWTGQQLITYLETGVAKPLPFSDDFRKDEGWRVTWGAMRLENGVLRLEADDTTGATVFLDGSRLWKDYAYRATFDWTAGTNVTLLARYRDGGNYLSCTFGEGNVSINNTIDGKTAKLAVVKNDMPAFPGRETVLGMEVRGGTATCVSGGKAVATASVPETDGGIGLKSWDASKNVAKIGVKRVEVESL